MAKSSLLSTDLPIKSSLLFSTKISGSSRMSPTRDKTMDITYKYDPDSDALAIYFKKLGPGSVSRTVPLTEDYDVMVDYSNDLIALIEFISPSETMNVHFIDYTEPIDSKDAFILQPSFADNTLTLLFCSANKDAKEVSTIISDFSLLKVDTRIVGMKIHDVDKNVLGFK